MARLIEFLFFAIVFYILVRRIAAPFMSGFRKRDEERARERIREEERQRAMKNAPKIDRSGVKDAEYRDL